MKQQQKQQRLSFVIVLVLALLCKGHGFSASPWHKQPVRCAAAATTTGLWSTATSTTTTSTTAQQDLLTICRRLKEDNGIFILEKTAQDEFLAAVDDLLSVSEPPSPVDFIDRITGDWELLCTTTKTSAGTKATTSSSSSSIPNLLDKSSLPNFIQDGPLEQARKRFQSKANRDLTVIQRILTSDDDGTLNRIDNVIEFTPPKDLGSLFDNLPEALRNVNVNPLAVSTAKVTLVHDARLTADNLQLELSLQSVVWNVAGTSQFLQPDGANVLGINLPFRDLIQRKGSFETLYLDDNLRISKGTFPGVGALEQVRVFVRRGSAYTGPVAEDIATMESQGRLDETTNAQDEGVDVDEDVDPEFASNDDNDKDEHYGQDDVSPSDF